MEQDTNINNIPEVNKEMLSQNPMVGGVINEAAFDPVQFLMPTEPGAVMPAKYSPEKIDSHEEAGTNSPMDDLKSSLENNTHTESRSKFGGTWAYDADYTGVFYDRYADMKNVFSKYGFSPWRDNESLYNDKSSWTDNFKRSLNNSMSLAGLSFNGALPWNAWSSDISKEDAVTQERAFAKGYDSRGGFGSFMNNQVLNSGFTVGILGEFAVEAGIEGALSLALAPETAGASLAGLADIGRKGYNAVKAIDKITDVAKVGERIRKSAQAFKEIDLSRKFYNVVNAERLGKALTPNLVTEIKEMQRLSRAGEDLTNLAKISKGAGAFYKDVRIVTASVAESKMEAGSVELKIRDEITQEFFKENGRMPDANEQANLAIKAHEGAMSTFWYNIPALYLSNKIVFDKAFSSMKPLRASAEEMANVTRRFGIEAVEGGFKEYEKGARSSVKRAFTKNAWQPKNLSKNILTGLGKYTKANFAEGIQEQYQEGVSDAFTRYYKDQFFNPFTTGSKLSYLTTGLAKQVTTSQGWETFASGFMMGGLIQGPQHLVFTKGKDLLNMTFQKDRYNKAKEQEKETVLSVVNSLNEVDGFLKKYSKGDSDANASVLVRNAQDLAHATEAQNKKAHIDIIDDSLSNHFYTLAAAGKLSVIQDQIKDYMKMNPEEMQQAFGITETGDAAFEKANQKLGEMLSTSKNIEERYKAVNEAYVNPFNEMRYNFKKDPIRFMKEQQNRQAFEQAKKWAVMSSYHFDKTVDRMESLYNKAAQTPVKNAPASDFQVLYGTNMDLKEELNRLKSEIKAADESTGLSPKDRAYVSIKKQKLEILTTYYEDKDFYAKVLQTGTAEEVTKAKNAMYDSYAKYTKVIAKGQHQVVFNNKIEETFNDIIDFHALGDEKAQLANAVNMLNNPEGLGYLTNRIAKVYDQLNQNRQEELIKSLQAFKDHVVLNKTLNKLLDIGVFIDEPQMKDLLEGKEVTQFYEMGDKLTPLPPKSDKYLQAMDIIKEFRLEKGFITPESIVEEQEAQIEEAKVQAAAVVEVNQEGVQKDDVKALLAKGFRQAFIDTLTSEETEDIFKNGLTQQDVQAKRNAAEVEAKDKEIQKTQKERAALTNKFLADLEEVKDGIQLEELVAEISTHPLESYDYEKIDSIAKDKAKKFTDEDYQKKQVTFDMLNDGDYVYLRKEGSKKMYIIIKLKDGFKFYLEGTDANQAQTVYSPEDAPKLILAKAGMKAEDVAPQISPEVKEASNHDVDLLAKSKEAASDFEKAKTMDASTRRGNLKKNKGCK